MMTCRPDVRFALGSRHPFASTWCRLRANSGHWALRPGSSIVYVDVFCQRCVPYWEIREVRFDQPPWSVYGPKTLRFALLWDDFPPTDELITSGGYLKLAGFDVSRNHEAPNTRPRVGVFNRAIGWNSYREHYSILVGKRECVVYQFKTRRGIEFATIIGGTKIH